MPRINGLTNEYYNSLIQQNVDTIRDIPQDVLSIAAGKYPEFSVFNITAYTNELPTITKEIIHEGTVSGLNITFPSTAEKFSIASTSANDTFGGTGANTVFIQGLDVNLEEVIEVVALNGQTPVLTTNNFFRVNRFFCFTGGSSEQNEGEICISSENETWSSGSPTTTLYNDIAVNKSWAMCGVYTTPGTVNSTPLGNFIVSTNLSGNKEAFIDLRSRRAGSSIFLQTGNIPLTTGTSGFNIRGSGVYTPGTDITLEGVSNQTGTRVQIYFLLYNYTAAD